MLKVVVLDYIRDILQNPAVRNTFADLIYLRQSSFMGSNPKILAIEPTDLIATHIVLYEEQAGKSRVIGGARILLESRCLDLEQPFPLANLVRNNGMPEHQKAFEMHRKNVNGLRQVSFLCVDPQYRWHEAHLSTADLLVWGVSLWSIATGDGACFTLNMKYKMDRWVRKAGLWPILPPIEHPLVPDPHELVFINRFHREYISEMTSAYGGLFREAKIFSSPNIPGVPQSLEPDQIRQLPDAQPITRELPAASGESAKVYEWPAKVSKKRAA